QPYPGGGYPPGTQYPGGGYPPGTQYPGGGYPPGTGYPNGGPIGGHGRNGTQSGKSSDKTQAATESLSGMLRRISATELVLEPEHRRLITVSLDKKNTKYQKSSGAAEPGDFRPGDQVKVDATKDDHGYYHGVTVTLAKMGTAEDRAAASQPVDTS